jgi:ATP-dependent Zn protease
MIVDDLISVVAPPDVRSPPDVRRAAVHEAGHAVAQIALGGAVESVTVVAAAGNGGLTRMGASASPFPTAADLDAVATMMLAGRAAEAVILGAPSAGAESDLRSVTELVCSLHASAGLADSLLHLAPTGAAAALLLTDPVLRQAVSRHVAKLYAEAPAPRGDRRGRRRAHRGAPADRRPGAGDLRSASERGGRRRA